jgi:tRNA(fMet)-specific endonuclease VapC
MDFLWDTSILIHCIRGSAFFDKINRQYDLLNSPNRSFLSIVSVGEIYSIAIQRRWGPVKRNALDEALRQIQPLTIAKRSVVQAYAEIDAFSQGKHPDKQLPIGLTSRNMGKNDLWIAATASVIGAHLITTDQDFQHLDGAFLSVIWPT